MIRLIWFLTLILILILNVPASAADIDVGDPAPPLKISKWASGKAVTPDKPDGKTVYVVEFWATWCPPCRTSIPHLNKLHEKYKDKDVVFIGISSENVSTVKKFMKKQVFKYRVAIDKNRGTWNAYRGTEGGIPHCYIVDRKGKIAWGGHPMGKLATVLKGVVAGTYKPIIPTAEEKARAAKIAKHTKIRMDAFQKNDFATASKSARILVNLQPQDFREFHILQIILTKKGDAAGLAKARTAAAKRWNKSYSNLANLAHSILQMKPHTKEGLKLAHASATRAVALDKTKNPAIAALAKRTAKALEEYERNKKSKPSAHPRRPEWEQEETVWDMVKT
jgi:thiol-disulfide isomerase/thioredoxin